MFNFLMTDF